MATIARPQKAKHQARIIFLCVALLAAFYALFIFTDLSDVLNNITYTPPAEVSALADKLSLTGKARTPDPTASKCRRHLHLHTQRMWS